jgi:hypothetical protein
MAFEGLGRQDRIGHAGRIFEAEEISNRSDDPVRLG